MKSHLFDHVDLRVRDRKRAEEFFGRILPALGFRHDISDPEWGAFRAGKAKRTPFFGFTEDKDHRPNETRIAFWAETIEAVDRLAKTVAAAGGKNLEGPQIWPEYSAGYYALFFEDPDGNKFEICCRGAVNKSARGRK